MLCQYEDGQSITGIQWEAERYNSDIKNERGSDTVCVFGRHREICRIKRTLPTSPAVGWDDEDARRIASLIAAAPELLEIVRDLPIYARECRQAGRPFPRWARSLTKVAEKVLSKIDRA